MGKTRATRDVKLIPIGTSKGICLPGSLLEKYRWGDSLVLEEREDGILLYGELYGEEKPQLSWKETYRAMAAEGEDWDDLDVTVADGLD